MLQIQVIANVCLPVTETYTTFAISHSARLLTKGITRSDSKNNFTKGCAASTLFVTSSLNMNAALDVMG